MPSNYKEIREKNIEEYGKGTRHLSRFADLYTKRTHFIYELIQNAEDALSRHPTGSRDGYVCFNLFKDRLEFRHNGALFVENIIQKDVSGICGIDESTKSGDYTQIGKFGIGFKSVYAYTFFPRVYSGDEHFEIRRFVEPYGLDAIDKPIMRDVETCIVLPFDSEEARPEWAFRDLLPAEQAIREISDALRNLGTRSLLFLRHVYEIRWTLPDTTSGHFLREVTNETPVSRLVTVIDNKKIEEWQVFQRKTSIIDGKDINDITVEAAFLLEDRKVRRAQNTELIAYFPTEKKTGLGFLIQAPFKITQARDNIKSDDCTNQQIIDTASKLAADSLEYLRDLGMLDVLSYNALPLEIPEDNIFQPIYDEIRTMLKKEPLLPAHGGGFIKAEEAKLARGAELTELFSTKQICRLFDKQKLNWIDSTITETGVFSTFYTYIVGRRIQWSREWEIEPLTEGLQVDGESLAPRLNHDFLASQNMPWIIRFIRYVENSPKIFKEKKVPIIRLENGKHTCLPTYTGEQLAYFRPKDDSGLDLSKFPLVASALSDHKEVRTFLTREGIREIDDLAIVEKCILPKYHMANIPVDENKRDIVKIVHVCMSVSQEEKQGLIKRLQEIPFICAYNPTSNSFTYMRPMEVYFHNDELLEYFSANKDVGFVSEKCSSSELLEILKELGVKDNIRVISESKPLNMDDVRLDGYRLGANGFDPNIEVDGLEYALENLSIKKSEIIWNRIAITYSNCISGEILRFSRKNYPRESMHISEKTVSLKFGNLLLNKEWLPDRDGNFHRPSELGLDDLPEGFFHDERLRKQLEMKSNLLAELLEESNQENREEKEKIIAHILRIDDQEEIRKLLEIFSDKEKKPVFPQSSSLDLERGEKQRKDQIDNASEKQYEQRNRSVRTSRGTIEPKVWLKNYYTNESDQMICQICKDEMPFKKRDGEYYFEAVEALSEKYFPLELEVQSLALCPLCAAMYKEFIINDESVMGSLKNELQNAEEPEVSLRLGELSTSLKFVEKHFYGIKQVLNESTKLSADD